MSRVLSIFASEGPSTQRHPASDRAAENSSFPMEGSRAHRTPQSEENDRNFHKAKSLFTEHNHQAMFGKTPKRWSRKYVDSIATAYALGDKRTRWFIEENIVSIANDLWSRDADTAEEAITYVNQHLVASDYGIPAPLTEGAL